MSTVQPAQTDDDFEVQMEKLLDQLRDYLCGILDLLHEYSSSALHDTQIPKYARQIDALDDFVYDVLDGWGKGQDLDLEALHFQASGLFTAKNGLHGIVEFPVGYIAYFFETKDSSVDSSACNRAHQAYSDIVTKWEAQRGPLPSAEVYAAAGRPVLGKRRWDGYENSAASGDVDDSRQYSFRATSIARESTAESSSKRPRLKPRSRR